jgi:excisionase family DNA binding protein
MSHANIHPQLYIKATEASRILGVERRTLFRWAKAGRLPYLRPGDRSHWRFDYQTICNLAKATCDQNKTCTEQRNEGEGCVIKTSTEQEQQGTAIETTKDDTRIESIYARVSTSKQLDYLNTQVSLLHAKYPSAIVFRDCASGLNFKRKGLLSLLQQVLAGRVRVVHIAYRDRLCRFAYDLVEHIFKHHGTEISVEAHNSSSPESELAEDVLSIITVFSARMHGRRSGAARGGGGA